MNIVNTLEESITAAMEDFNTDLIKYYPYLFQDYWELGTPANEIIKIIKKHKLDYLNLSVLDLGSGKGAVSVKIASELGCRCRGIDGMTDFVAFSKTQAKEYGVGDICHFEVNDVRTRIKSLGKYDVIILGAIGPVLGDFYQTLTILKDHLNKDGLVIMNEGYVEDGYTTDYPNVFQKGEILEQINKSGMELIETITDDEFPELNEYLEFEAKNLEKRCNELMETYPEDKNLLLKYIKRQKELYHKLTNEVKSIIFVIK